MTLLTEVSQIKSTVYDIIKVENLGVCHRISMLFACRYLVICYPMKAQYISTSARAKKIITVVWLSAIGLSVPPANFVSGVFLNNSINIITKQIYIINGFR